MVFLLSLGAGSSGEVMLMMLPLKAGKGAAGDVWLFHDPRTIIIHI